MVQTDTINRLKSYEIISLNICLYIICLSTIFFYVELQFYRVEADKKLSSIVTELFLRGQKLNILLVFVSQSFFKVPKTIRLNATNYFFMKIPNKRELQQIASNHSSDSEFKDFV